MDIGKIVIMSLSVFNKIWNLKQRWSVENTNGVFSLDSYHLLIEVGHINRWLNSTTLDGNPNIQLGAYWLTEC